MENKEGNIAKVKGFNVNLAEITDAICAISAVKLATTIIYHIADINYICSYVSVNSPITKEAIREFLNSILPYYMIPAYIIFLDDFPINSNGDINKALLPPPIDFDIIKNKEDFALPEEKVDTKDLKKFDKLLEKNSISNIKQVNETPIGDVLLTGVTKPIGMHILANLIRTENSIVYCLLRDKNGMSAMERLENCLHSYFGNFFDIDIGTRIRIVRGRPCEYEFGLTEEEYDALGIQVNTVIHCAELYDENENYEALKESNVKGTQKIVDFCEDFHINLIYLSTFSIFEDISGLFSEKDFYIGQTLKKSYVKSKFESEKIVLDSIYHGLNSYIIRLDNIEKNQTSPKLLAPLIIRLAKYYNNTFSIFHLIYNIQSNSNIDCKFTKKFLEHIS